MMNKKNKLHQKKYDKFVKPIYKGIHDHFNAYITSFKKNEDKFAADWHCIHNLFVFGFARLKLMAQQSKDEKACFDDALNEIIKKGVEMGSQKVNLPKHY